MEGCLLEDLGADLFLVVLGAAQETRLDVDELERHHLVFHERDERRDDDGEAFEVERRKLVAERLALAGGHDHELVALLLDQRLDDFELKTIKREREIKLSSRDSG